VGLESILKSLGVFNLSLYEAKAYLALLEKETLSPVEVAAISGVPRGRVYEILNRLLEKGLCFLVPGDVKQYKATNPEIFKEKIETKIEYSESDINIKIEKLQSDIEARKKIHDSEIMRKKANLESKINRLMKEFDLKIDREKRIFNQEIDRKERLFDSNIRKEKQVLSDLKKNANDVISKLTDTYKKGRDNDAPQDNIEILKNPRQIDDKFVNLFRESKKEALTLTKQRFYHMDEELLGMVNKQTKSVTEVISKGLSVRCIYELKPDEKENKFMCKNVIDKFVAAGEQARVMKDIPMRIAIFDEETVMYTIVDAEGHCSLNGYYTQVVRNKMMAKSLKILFETLWDKAEDYSEYIKRMKH
jgi:sugar-specific transcriptional regulator TrmB